MMDDYIPSNPHHLLPSVCAPAYAGSVHALVVKVIACGFQYKAKAHKGEAFEVIKIVHFFGQIKKGPEIIPGQPNIIEKPKKKNYKPKDHAILNHML